MVVTLHVLVLPWGAGLGVQATLPPADGLALAVMG